MLPGSAGHGGLPSLHSAVAFSIPKMVARFCHAAGRELEEGAGVPRLTSLQVHFHKMEPLKVERVSWELQWAIGL